MSRIFELFGFPLDDQSEAADHHRRHAWCPYMGTPCDGGGNRYLSQIDLSSAAISEDLKTYYATRTTVHCGICSIQPGRTEQPWIVCPRRLLYLGENQRHQAFARALVRSYGGFSQGARIGVWPELRMHYTDAEGRSFGYTFDYVLTRLDGDLSVGPPVVIEIMTCSTSGGNRTRRTTIPMAFEDAILGRDHQAPSINKRQVWARMVSQLIVKSEAALAWGGRTLWVLQDTLVAYISSTTALELEYFRTEQPHEVNILSLAYGPDYGAAPLELGQASFYAGPITQATEPSFVDMIRASVVPPLSELRKRLAQRPPAFIWQGT